MDEMIFFDNAKDSITSFFDKEFANFPPLVMSHFLNKFNDLLNYSEEGTVIRPKLVFTSSIETIVKTLPKAHAIPIFVDKDASDFNKRMKSLFAIVENDWCVFIDIKPTAITYGLAMSFNSIKEKNFLRALEENTTLKDKQVSCIVTRPLNFYTMQLHSVSGNNLVVNFSLDKTKYSQFSNEIKEFVDATFSKLRTTPRKLLDVKNMYYNIFATVLNDVNGTICVVVDKDYKDTGMFEDGIWLKEPISFSKLFAQSKSYNERKLRIYAELFIKMVNFDGITIMDNSGRILAYNVFVEPNSKKLGYIVGGARKRAAYHIISTKRKGIVGVFFLSHEGEVFYHSLHSNNDDVKKAAAKKAEAKKLEVKKEEIKKEFTQTVQTISKRIEDNVMQLSFNVLENNVIDANLIEKKFDS